MITSASENAETLKGLASTKKVSIKGTLMQIWKSLHIFVSWKFRILDPKNSRVIRP